MPRRDRVPFRLFFGGIAGAWMLAACLDFGALSDDGGASLDAASSDGASGDAASPFDGQPFEAGPDARFCAANPGHTLCDDFDDDGWRAPWNLAGTLTMPGSVNVDTSSSVSPPSSLVAMMIPADASVPGYAFLETKFSSTPSSLHLAFDFELLTGGVSSVAVTNVLLSGQNGFALKLAQPVPPLFQVLEVSHPDGGPTMYSNIPGISFVVGTGWHHADITFDLTGADAGEVDVSFDRGSTVTTTFPQALPIEPAQSFSLQAGVGSYSSTPYSPATVRIDNYVVDAK